MLHFYVDESRGQPERRAMPRLPAVLFASPLMAFALTLLVPLVMILGD